MEHHADDDLVRRCVAGDPDAWEELVLGQTGRIEQTVRRYLASIGFALAPADIEEIVQIVFLALVANDKHLLRMYNPQYRLGTYITVIAQSQCQKYLRKRKPVERMFETSAVTGDDPSAAGAEVRELAARIEEVVKRLSSRDAIIVRLIYFDDRSYREIADFLRIAPGSISQIISRAKHRFIRELEKENLQRWLS